MACIIVGSTTPKSKKKGVSHAVSKPEKFDQVENALEAMFGLEDIQGMKREQYVLMPCSYIVSICI